MKESISTIGTRKNWKKFFLMPNVNFFLRKLSSTNIKTKSLWKVINEITKRKKQTKTIITKLSLGKGRVIENSVEIAKTLTEYFVAVGPNLADKLPPSTKSFNSYLRSEDSPVIHFA